MGRIFLLPHGTAGDVLPLIWVGRQMKDAGHEVTMIWTGSFRAAAEQAGLQYEALENDGFDSLVSNPLLWKQGSGMPLAVEFAGRCTAKYLVAARRSMALRGAPDLLVGPINAYAARLLREKLRVPFVSINLSPFSFFSAYEVPGGMVPLFRKLPLFLRRFILANTAPFDRFALPAVRQCCVENGIKPPRSLGRHWSHSPDGVLALFPSWYGAPQPDWPANTFQWDFPLEDLRDEKPFPAELDTFLNRGEAPVVFTFGSNNLHVRHFFETALEITRRLRRRAVFVIPDMRDLPAGIPASVLTVRYAPLSRLLPRTTALVHHGGTGTTALCLAAGRPQLIVSMTFDQPDNGERVEHLRAGLGMNISQFNVENALPLLQRCLEDAGIRDHAESCARRLQQRQPVSALVRWLEDRRCHPSKN